MSHGSFRKLGVPDFGVLIIRILLFRVLYLGPLFSETPTYYTGLTAKGPRGLCLFVGSLGSLGASSRVRWISGESKADTGLQVWGLGL